MTKITNIDARSGTQVVKGAIEKLQAYAEELGLAVKQEGRWVYDRNGKYLNLKLQFVVGGTSGQEDQAREEFKRNAFWYGLEEQDYGAILNIRGTRYKLVRINTRAKRYPFECERVGGGTGIRLPDVYKHEILAARSK